MINSYIIIHRLGTYLFHAEIIKKNQYERCSDINFLLILFLSNQILLYFQFSFTRDFSEEFQ